MADETTAQSPRPLPTTIGPGSAPPAQAEYIAALEGATQDEVVEILNPMTVDFVGQVGITKTAMMPVRINNPNNTSIKTESDLAAKGIPGFRNPDKGGGIIHVTQPVPIPAGTTIKQPGNVAQVIAKQLITAIIGVRGDKLRIADPETRRNVEKEIILSRRPMAELFGVGGPITVEEQMSAAIEKANHTAEEAAFPQLKLEEKRIGRAKSE